MSKGVGMAESEAQRRANLKWKRENVVQLKVSLFRASDADIIEHLQALKERGEGQSEYVRRLIREDMAKGE